MLVLLLRIWVSLIQPYREILVDLSANVLHATVALNVGIWGKDMSDTEKQKTEGSADAKPVSTKPQGRVTTDIKVVVELDEEKLECINGPGITTTCVVVT